MSRFSDFSAPPTCPAHIDEMDANEVIAWTECWTGADCDDEDYARTYLKRQLSQ